MTLSPSEMGKRSWKTRKSPEEMKRLKRIAKLGALKTNEIKRRKRLGLDK